MNAFKWTDIWKNKLFCVIAAIEVLLMIVGFAGLGRPARTIELLPGEENISLEPGIYLVSVVYQASEDGNELKVYDTSFETGTILFNDVSLYAGDNREDCQLWVLRRTDTVGINVEYQGSGELVVEELCVTTTNIANRIFLFCLLIISCLVNGLFLFRLYDKKIGIPPRRKLIWGILAAAFFCLSTPLFVNYNLWGHDWGFHLLRVEGLISGLQDGQFPVRIQGNWLRGYGYAVSVFYSDLFLLIPALLRTIGFTVNTTELIFIAIINGATLLIAYQCFRKCFHDDMAGAVSAVLYSLSSYRLHNVYIRYALGEMLAMVFLPMVFYGFYQLFTDDIHGKNYKKHWLVLALGLTGVLQSHVLTCEMLAFSIVLLCLVLLPKVFRRETFLQLCKAAVITVLLNLWYLIPFLDYFMTQKFNVGNSDTMIINNVQSWGLYPAHALMLFYGKGGQGNVGATGMEQTGAYTIGAALMLGIIVWLYLEFTGKCKQMSSQFRGLGRMMFGFTCLFFVLVSRYFPWSILENMGGIVEKLVLSLQFPYRFLELACLTASILAGVIVLCWKEISGREANRGWVLLFLATAFFFCAYQTNHLLMDRGFARVYNKEGMGTTYISNGEYLPYQTDIEAMVCDLVIAGEGVTVDAYEKGQHTLQTAVTVTNAGGESYVELPILYYRGYAAVDQTTGAFLPVEAGKNSVVRVLLPQGYHGSLHVYFKSPWYWRGGEILSVLTALSCVGSVFIRKRREVRS